MNALEVALWVSAVLYLMLDGEHQFSLSVRHDQCELSGLFVLTEEEFTADKCSAITAEICHKKTL